MASFAAQTRHACRVLRLQPRPRPVPPRQLNATRVSRATTFSSSIARCQGWWRRACAASQGGQEFDNLRDLRAPHDDRLAKPSIGRACNFFRIMAVCWSQMLSIQAVAHLHYASASAYARRLSHRCSAEARHSTSVTIFEIRRRNQRDFGTATPNFRHHVPPRATYQPAKTAAHVLPSCIIPGVCLGRFSTFGAAHCASLADECGRGID